MKLLTLLLLLVGLLLLFKGADLLVHGASRLAARLGISALVIGLTVVSFGTSSPELAVSLMSALQGKSNMAVANVVGSNIFNVLFILGVSALIVPLVVAQQLVWMDVPVMIGLSVLVLVLGHDGAISRPEGLLLVAGLVAYTVFSIRQSRRESRQIQEEYDQEYAAPPAGAKESLWLNVGCILLGLALLVVGSRWLVNGAVAIAQLLGVSDVVIGLTIVAAGTSLPEVAASIMAALRGERDIAVGNVVGSSIFNILCILGIAALAAPGGLAVSRSVINFDLPVMIVVAVACLPIFFTGHLIARWEGGLFLLYYLAYTAYLILDATQHDALPEFSRVMLNFVLPLTAVTLVGVTLNALRNRARDERRPSGAVDP